jgi:hypothetical protein
MAMGKNIVFEVPRYSLPEALINSAEYKSLNETQKNNYAGRLNFVEQITLEADEWVSGNEVDLYAFLDRIELHLSINLGSPVDPQTHVSSWLIHTSWTFETSAKKMRNTLPSKLIDVLDYPQPSLECELAEFNLWLGRQNAALKSAIEKFYAADTFDCAMSFQIALDILLINLLSGITKMRINPKVFNS